ncbi:MAG: glycosyltransferase [Candidatus Micrarchaeota archaeon]|nr:glycosyltransferase [Candidatus Micrarchaeota archaeon]MDE1847563.1 glycosyltransferase [Candidatus Micrarchaeota archaeon]MDE1864280.1 glycosyltransferase [Candidatus Micrarchaeota archaeon]
MKVAIITLVKPQEGSGDGITEYTHQIHQKLKGKVYIALIYPLSELKRQDTVGLIYANSLFKLRIKKLAKENYDVIHIAHPELGFAAKILRENGSKARIISCIHDLMRLDKGFHKGVIQGAYNYIVSANIRDAIKYSNFIIFTSSSVQKDVLSRFKQIKHWSTTLLGTKDYFITTRIPKKPKHREFRVGYVGSFAYHKNVIFILKTALQLLKNKEIKFIIYGTGAEKKHLNSYKSEMDLVNVRFMGFAPEEKLLQIYDGFDAFFWPSTGDSSSFPIEDAKARGLPIVVCKKNIFDEEVKNYVFEARDPKHSARILINLKMRGFSKKMRDAELKYAESISWSNTARKTLDIYKKVLGKHQN